MNRALQLGKTLAACVLLCVWAGAVSAQTSVGNIPLAPSFAGVLYRTAVWDQYKARFLSPDGRIIDTANLGISHSEGQGYGMLLALAANDPEAFATIWTWTRQHLQIRGDHLLAWKWDPQTGKIADRNNASDGDILVAWALAEAATYWKDATYREAATLMARNIASSLIRRTAAYGQVLLPGASGFSLGERTDGPIANLSYWIYPAFGRLRQLAPHLGWREMASNGLSILDAARFGASQVPSEWVSLNARVPAPASNPAPEFGYNAIRIPLYLIWGGQDAKAHLNFLRPLWLERHQQLQVINIRDPRDSSPFGERGYDAIASMTRCALAGEPYPTSFYSVDTHQNYYPVTLHLLALVAAISRNEQCLDPAALTQFQRPEPVPMVAQILPTVAMATPMAPVVPRNPVRADYEAPVRAAVVTAPTETSLNDADDPDVTIVDLIAGAGLLALAGCLVGGLRAITRHSRSRRDVPEEITQPAAFLPVVLPDGNVPRVLPVNPFESREHALDVQIDASIEASLRHGRTVGVLIFELPVLQAIAREKGPDFADQTLDNIVATIRGNMRTHDYVGLRPNGEILICVPLLRHREDFFSVSRRLKSLVTRLGRGSEYNYHLEAGHAIYPLDGYSGSDLIESARSQLPSARLEPNALMQLPQPVETEELVPEQLSLMLEMPRKPARR